MIKVICDRCGKELEKFSKTPNFIGNKYGFVNRFYDGYDFCDECGRVYEQLKEEVGKKRKELIEKYEKEMEKEMEKEEKRILKGLKEDV